MRQVLPRPSYDRRKQARDECVRDFKQHLEQQGKQPTDREVERFVDQNVERTDNKERW